MINLKELREQILKHLKNEGISVNAFAKRIGLQQPTLYRFLKGETEPNIKNLNKILKALKESNKAA